MEKFDYLIIGGGITGTTAAEEQTLTMRHLTPHKLFDIENRDNFNTK